ncbi:hypothetical protein NDU88_011280 [Pleurodeles waltl]|uniref:Uncharacterized protein n=1 Tax=Pleurodeles waltl TaxID=8319 RepID=A0AAV7Q4K5_PLEWA|nr:hypothetical protein NDU88_011280 [Pleurodeles waltl]
MTSILLKCHIRVAEAIANKARGFVGPVDWQYSNKKKQKKKEEEEMKEKKEMEKKKKEKEKKKEKKKKEEDSQRDRAQHRPHYSLMSPMEYSALV